MPDNVRYFLMAICYLGAVQFLVAGAWMFYKKKPIKAKNLLIFGLALFTLTLIRQLTHH